MVGIKLLLITIWSFAHSRNALDSVVELPAHQYSQTPVKRLLGHSELNNRTTWLATLFLPGKVGLGWKQVPIDAIERHRAAI